MSAVDSLSFCDADARPFELMPGIEVHGILPFRASLMSGGSRRLTMATRSMGQRAPVDADGPALAAVLPGPPLYNLDIVSTIQRRQPGNEAMSMIGRWRRGALVFALAMTLTQVGLESGASAQGKELVVFAAASLKTALDAINQRFEHDAARKVTASYAASSALAKQIEAGAPADIFISADLDWMDYLARKSLIQPQTRFNLLANKLVLIAPADSKLSIEIGENFPLAKALGDGRLAMADPNAVPAGKYGKASLEALGVWTSVAAKIAPAENVRAALLYVARRETPLGIVYQTDAAAEPGVKIVGTFPDNTHPPIIYPAALTASASNPDAASYLAFLKSPAARSLFQDQGFSVLP
jgi:molybdate transport system substrate-binding protein